MKKIILTLVTLFTLHSSLFTASATNVSGGIYANTTWTFANSPYIVTDTVVVFPGVTLTIEAGVVVKFADHMYIEIRQANLIAIGTALDSITFTSNNASPTPGIWGGPWYIGGILLNGGNIAQFNYCSFSYSTTSIYNYSQDTFYLRNSIFTNNLIGVHTEGIHSLIDTCSFSYNTTSGIQGSNVTINFCKLTNNGYGLDQTNGFVEMTNCIANSNGTGLHFINASNIQNCIINYNQVGIEDQDGDNLVENCNIEYNTTEGYFIEMAMSDLIRNCLIRYNNGYGIIDMNGSSNRITKCVIENNITGIRSTSSTDSFYCNKICNNSSYELYYDQSGNLRMANNDWCNTDSATIHSHIYDGYTNINVGLVSVFPIDTVQCFLSTTCSANFYLYPDTNILHHYWIIDSAYGTGTLSYLWSWGDGNYDSIPYPSHTYADSGFYNICLTITDSVGCTSTFCYNSYHIMRTTNTMYYVDVINPNNFTTGINAYALGNHCSILPNPNDGNFVMEYHLSNLQLSIDNCKLKITDIAGRILNSYSISNNDGTLNINATSLSKGIYFWEMISPEGIMDKGKMIILK